MLAVRVTLVATLLIFSIILDHSNGLEVDVNVAIKPPKEINTILADCPVCGEAECIADVSCEEICGSDGKNYCNECDLKCGQCGGSVDPDVTKVSDGPCLKKGTGIVGPWWKNGRNNAIKPPKDCPVCFEIECTKRTRCEQICGSDGKNYCNECHLKCGQCKGKYDPDVTKVGNGTCRKKGTGIVGPWWKNGRNNNCPVCGEIECTKRTRCEQICGSDGKNYCNECHLKCGQCEGKYDPDVTKVGNGTCRNKGRKNGRNNAWPPFGPPQSFSSPPLNNP